MPYSHTPTNKPLSPRFAAESRLVISDSAVVDLESSSSDDEVSVVILD
jgi:hypothetical protein